MEATIFKIPLEVVCLQVIPQNCHPFSWKKGNGCIVHLQESKCPGWWQWGGKNQDDGHNHAAEITILDLFDPSCRHPKLNLLVKVSFKTVTLRSAVWQVWKILLDKRAHFFACSHLVDPAQESTFLVLRKREQPMELLRGAPGDVDLAIFAVLWAKLFWGSRLHLNFRMLGRFLSKISGGRSKEMDGTET